MDPLIAPPSTDGPMTKEDIEIVRAEKQLDAMTREKLVEVYGDSRGAYSRPVPLTRRPNQGWACPQCRKTSLDIRRVCAFCLCPEPHAAQAPRPAAPADIKRPGESNDRGAALSVMPHTSRVYRIFTEPVASQLAVKKTGATTHEETETHAAHYDEDEPDCDGEDDGCGVAAAAPAAQAGGEAFETTAATVAAGVIGDGQGASSSSPTTAKRGANPSSGGGGYTHFLSLPIGTRADLQPPVRAALEQLHAAVEAAAAEDPAANLSPQLISQPAQLHLTLLMLRLPTPEAVCLAKEVLDAFGRAWRSAAKAPAVRYDASSGRPLVALKGLEVMPPANAPASAREGDPRRASVVYLKPAGTADMHTLQHFTALLHHTFSELIEDQGEAARSLSKPHVTVLNTKWVKGGKRVFDASGVMDACAGRLAVGLGPDSALPFEVTAVELNARRTDPKTQGYVVESAVEL